jgi:branched-chain amino acid transport system permease protein
MTFIILHLFLTRTLLGKAMRAIPKDIEAAKMLGINPASIYNYSMGISVALAGIAGVILGLLYQFDPFTGVSYMVISLGVVIIGGLGSIKGTIVGGIATGLAYVLGGYFLGPLFQYVVCYLLILIALIIKPTGLFGGG